MLKQKYQNKLILVFSFLLIIIFVISLFFFQQNGENSQTIKAKLITSVHKDLPFEFETEEANVLIVPGEVKTINYTVKNLSKKSMNGMATFQVYPSELKDFITRSLLIKRDIPTYINIEDIGHFYDYNLIGIGLKL